MWEDENNGKHDARDRQRNRRDAMELARRAAAAGDPIAGSLFADFGVDPFYEFQFEDDSDECRPY